MIKLTTASSTSKQMNILFMQQIETQLTPIPIYNMQLG